MLADPLRSFDEIQAGENFFMDPLIIELSSEPNFRLNFWTFWPTVFFGMEEGLKVSPAEAPVLAGVGLVGGVGTRGEVGNPLEDAGSAGAAGAGLGLLWKVHSCVQYSGRARGFPVATLNWGPSHRGD